MKEAEASYQAALDIQKVLAEKHPDVPKYQADLASTHNNLGNLYVNTGRTKEAEAAYQAALDIYRALVEKHPEVPKYQADLADTHKRRIEIEKCMLDVDGRVVDLNRSAPLRLAPRRTPAAARAAPKA